MTDTQAPTPPETSNAAPAPGLTFKTQLAAVDWLTAQGFKVGKSKFNDDVKKHKRISLNAEGHFDAAVLLAYAGVHLTPLARAEHSGQVNASAKNIDASARLKDIQAQRQELKFQKEQGLLMHRAEHEAQLAARALFFKDEIQNFVRLKAAAIIHLVEGREDALALLIEWLDEETAVWMDAWAADREFVVGDDDAPTGGDEDMPGDELGDGVES